jgi:hypothetical protein
MNMIDLGLGFVYLIASVCFAIIWIGASDKENWLYILVGKYGMILMFLLAVFQTNIDYGYATTPNSLGIFLWFIISLLLLFLVIDILYFIIAILPRKKKGNSWKLIMFGKVNP